jgi:hypothetical protein
MLELPKQNRTEVIEELGNLTDVGKNKGGGRRSARALFLPGSHWSAVERAATHLLRGERSFSKEERKGLLNLRGLGVLDEAERPTFSDVADLRKRAAEVLSRMPYKEAWSRIETGDEIESLLRSWEGSDVADSTIRWRAKILAHWGRELGLVGRPRRKQSRRGQSRLALRSG